MENLSIVETADGSKTIFNAEVGEHYHSNHGALQESLHVFVNAGLKYYLENNPSDEVNICEVGFGTGLNFLLTADYCTAEKIKLNYTGIEAFPLEQELNSQTGYDHYVSDDVWTSYQQKYVDCLKNPQQISTCCTLKIEPVRLLHFDTNQKFNLIYYDAFAVRYQPEMWSDESIKHILKFLKVGGVFVTYAITGNLKRSLQSLGCTIQKIPGAGKKREMLRAVKNTNSGEL